MTHAEMKQFFDRVKSGGFQPNDEELTAAVEHFETCEEDECKQERARARDNEQAREKMLRALWGDEDSYGFEKQWKAQWILNNLRRRK